MQVPWGLNMVMSGVPYWGTDIGGFFHPVPESPELFARWFQFGAFCALFRAHGWVWREHLPWAHGPEVEAICRRYGELRMRLLPYLYGLFEEASRTGAPMLRPLLFEYFDDPVTYTADDEFLLGDSLLVAPITRPGVEHRHVYLPRGTWVQWWTGEVVTGPAHVLAHAPLGRPALYVRGNAAIPLWPVRMHTGEPVERLTLRVFAGGPEPVTSSVFEDAGDGYEPGSRFSVTVDGLVVQIFAREGGYEPPYPVEVEAGSQRYPVPFLPAEITLR